MIAFDKDEQVSFLMDTSPQRLLAGPTPRLIDEWQEYPTIWNYIRHEVDQRNLPGQFILTGSANPEEAVKMHSGAGRFTILDMRTMSWQELGYSTGSVRLAHLLESKKINTIDQPTGLELIVERIIRGGFPSLMNKSTEAAIEINRAYIDLLSEVDMSRVSDIRRKPDIVRNHAEVAGKEYCHYRRYYSTGI